MTETRTNTVGFLSREVARAGKPREMGGGMAATGAEGGFVGVTLSPDGASVWEVSRVLWGKGGGPAVCMHLTTLNGKAKKWLQL